MDADKNPLFLDEQLTRSEFQKITQDLLDRTRQPFQQVIKDAGISVADIDHVVLVGGSTRMPAVTDLVKELTGGKEPNKGVNPTRSSRWARPCRPACSGARSRTSCCSMSPRCRWASRPRAA